MIEKLLCKNLSTISAKSRSLRKLVLLENLLLEKLDNLQLKLNRNRLKQLKSTNKKTSKTSLKFKKKTTRPRRSALIKLMLQTTLIAALLYLLLNYLTK